MVPKVGHHNMEKDKRKGEKNQKKKENYWENEINLAVEENGDSEANVYYNIIYNI